MNNLTFYKRGFQWWIFYFYFLNFRISEVERVSACTKEAKLLTTWLYRLPFNHFWVSKLLTIAEWFNHLIVLASLRVLKLFVVVCPKCRLVWLVMLKVKWKKGQKTPVHFHQCKGVNYQVPSHCIYTRPQQPTHKLRKQGPTS